jgi:Xaa-Pro aminopeptidase
MALLPEFYLQKGDLLLQVKRNGTNPIHWFQRALEEAPVFGARMSELRAAIRVCRSSRDEEEVEHAGKALQQVYEAFTEGFETLDLVEAKELLESLG